MPCFIMEIMLHHGDKAEQRHSKQYKSPLNLNIPRTFSSNNHEPNFKAHQNSHTTIKVDVLVQCQYNFINKSQSGQNTALTG